MTSCKTIENIGHIWLDRRVNNPTTPVSSSLGRRYSFSFDIYIIECPSYLYRASPNQYSDLEGLLISYKLAAYKLTELFDPIPPGITTRYGLLVLISAINHAWQLAVVLASAKQVGVFFQKYLIWMYRILQYGLEQPANTYAERSPGCLATFLLLAFFWSSFHCFVRF